MSIEAPKHLVSNCNDDRMPQRTTRNDDAQIMKHMMKQYETDIYCNCYDMYCCSPWCWLQRNRNVLGQEFRQHVNCVVFSTYNIMTCVQVQAEECAHICVYYISYILYDKYTQTSLRQASRHCHYPKRPFLRTLWFGNFRGTITQVQNTSSTNTLHKRLFHHSSVSLRPYIAKTHAYQMHIKCIWCTLDFNVSAFVVIPWATIQCTAILNSTGPQFGMVWFWCSPCKLAKSHQPEKGRIEWQQPYDDLNERNGGHENVQIVNPILPKLEMQQDDSKTHIDHEDWGKDYVTSSKKPDLNAIHKGMQLGQLAIRNQIYVLLPRSPESWLA